MSDALAVLNRLIAGLPDAISTGLDKAAEHAAEVARSKTSGELAQSVKVVKPSRYARKIVAKEGVAEFVENGRPGFVARLGKALSFVMGGKTIFVKSVGPAPAHPFMAPAHDDLEAKASVIVEKEIRSLL